MPSTRHDFPRDLSRRLFDGVRTLIYNSVLIHPTINFFFFFPYKCYTKTRSFSTAEQIVPTHKSRHLSLLVLFFLSFLGVFFFLLLFLSFSAIILLRGEKARTLEIIADSMLKGNMPIKSQSWNLQTASLIQVARLINNYNFSKAFIDLFLPNSA